MKSESKETENEFFFDIDEQLTSLNYVKYSLQRNESL